MKQGKTQVLQFVPQRVSLGRAGQNSDGILETVLRALGLVATRAEKTTERSGDT